MRARAATSGTVKRQQPANDGAGGGGGGVTDAFTWLQQAVSCQPVGYVLVVALFPPSVCAFIREQLCALSLLGNGKRKGSHACFSPLSPLCYPPPHDPDAVLTGVGG